MNLGAMLPWNLVFLVGSPMVNRSEGRFQTKHGPTKHTGVGGYKTRALPHGPIPVCSSYGGFATILAFPSAREVVQSILQLSAGPGSHTAPNT